MSDLWIVQGREPTISCPGARIGRAVGQGFECSFLHLDRHNRFPEEPPKVVLVMDEAAWAALVFSAHVRMRTTADGFYHRVVFKTPWAADVPVMCMWRHAVTPRFLEWVRLELAFRSRAA